LHQFAEIIETNNRRVFAVHIRNSANVNLQLANVNINVYMPCESTNDEHEELFYGMVAVISHLTDTYPEAVLILGGDFNVDFARESTHCRALLSLCSQIDVLPVVKHVTSTVDFTCNLCMERFNSIHHFFVSKYVFDSCIESVSVCHDVDNHSDHDSLLLHLNICWSAHAYLSQTRSSATA